MSGKIGNLTADEDKKLLRYYATAMYAYTSAPLRSAEEKQANELSDKLEAELLRRLSAAPQVQETFPEKARKLLERFRELDAVRLSPSGNEQEEMDDTLAELLDGKTAATPSRAQARCPKCGSKELDMATFQASASSQMLLIDCQKCQKNFSVESDEGVYKLADFAQFFSSPSAPQVKDEIGCDMHANGRVKGCTGCDWINGEPSAERDRLRKALELAMKTANGRWSEWGGRAESVAEIIEAALQGDSAGGEG